MEGEITTFIKIWLAAILSGCYCYFLSNSTKKTLLRLLLILPIAAFFATSPYSLSSCHLSGATWFFLTWLGISKLLLFAFDAGPLSSSQQLSLPRFVCTLLLPIKIKQSDPNPVQGTGSGSSWVLFGAKVVGFGVVMEGYNHKETMSYWGMLGLYVCYLYLSLEIAFFMSGALARGSLGIEIMAQVNEPYLSSSLQDFWGKRWNLMVSDILRQTIHNPIRIISSPIIGKKPSILVGVFASFTVSGLMHEWIFYILTRVSPTWEVTCFFILQGTCLVVEIMIKMGISHKWQLHHTFSRLLTIGFLMLTSSWLFFPPLLRNKFHEKLFEEYVIVVSFLKRIVMFFF